MQMEQFQSSFRAVLKKVSEKFQSSFGAVSEHFQSSFGAVSEDNGIHLSINLILNELNELNN